MLRPWALFLGAVVLAGCGGPARQDPAASVGGPNVDSSCIDGRYSETLADPTVGIDEVVAAYQPASLNEFVLTVLERRYPFGQAQVTEALTHQDCVRVFLSDTSSASAVLSGLSTVVHECGHIVDLTRGQGTSSTYVINSDQSITCDQGNATELGGLTFSRSRIQGDAYAASWPPCTGATTQGCDFYAPIYLDGDPDDSTFQGGDQGFNMLLEEAVQYVNSLATGRAFETELARFGSVSDRDGILTFLWYIERYLHLARIEHPDAYAQLTTGDGACWRKAILTVWGRAWLYLESTRGQKQLGNQDAAIEALVETPELIDEIQRIRAAEGCN